MMACLRALPGTNTFVTGESVKAPQVCACVRSGGGGGGAWH
jgi:hypothetical protein